MRSASLRRGWARFVGPEASRSNSIIALGSAAVGAVSAATVARRNGAGVGSTAVLVGLAADLVGGAYVNNTRACVRWYDRAGQGNVEHLQFAACHVHPAIVGMADARSGARENVVGWAAAHYGYLMAATALIRALPSRRRALGVTLTVGGIALDRALGPSTVAPWFAWTYYPKLLLGHAAGALRPDDDLGVDISLH